MKLIDSFTSFQLAFKEKPAVNNVKSYRMSYIDAKQSDDSE